MPEWISLQADDGHAGTGYLATTEGPPLGAVIVLQEVFGVNRHIRWVAEQFAANGYHALAPCLFDRVGGNVDLEYTEAGITEGRARVAQLGFDPALRDVAAAAEYFGNSMPVGVVGYCWGGTLAFLAATRLGLPSVSYYGARSRPFFDERVQSPLLMHFGRNDPLIPPDFHDEFAAKHPDVPVHFYDAGHGFNCNERSDFHAPSAAMAWRRTLRFFREHLVMGDHTFGDTRDGPASDGSAATPGAFEIDARLVADTIELTDLALCRVLLMNDARFPWLILVPKCAGLREIHELDEWQQAVLMQEVVRAQRALTRVFAPDKLNVGALGNVVPQLHIHVIARFRGDEAWPGPVWGRPGAMPHAPGTLNALKRSLIEALTADASQ